MKVSAKELADFKSQLALVDIERPAIGEDKLYGFIVGFSEDLVLVREVDYILIAGLKLVRRIDITAVTEGETNVFQRSLIEAEGFLSDDVLKFQGPVHSYDGWLACFPKDQIFIIENELAEETEFYIGKIISADVDQVLLHNFNGAARWDEKIDEIPTNRITSAQTDSSYTNYYQRHFQRQEG